LKIFSKSAGFTLIETLIAIAIFAIISTGTYLAYSNVLDITIASQLNSTALTVIANELEVIRSLDYKDVGVQGGSPAGILMAQKNINFSGFQFILSTTVRNIDDPFDGILGGTPNDTAPADYRLIELELLCSTCPRFIPIRSTTTVGPANLESSSENGNLFITAIDSSGQPVPQANVSVINNLVNPAISINDITNNSGQLQLVDIATSSLGYQIIVTKPSYSTDKTYQPGAPSNPNPVKPHATVAKQQVTLATFSIDRLSTQTLRTRDRFCQAVPNINFNQQGTKLIGTDPDVLKYSINDETDSGGSKTSLVEWDAYSIQNTDPGYSLAGTLVLSPFNMSANTVYDINWLMEADTPLSILVTAQNDSGQMIDGADITLTKSGFSVSEVSGHNYFDQTDWSSGKFTQKSSNIEEADPSGEIHIAQVDGKYASMSQEFLESQTFDLGDAAIFYKFKWNPSNQPPQAGVNSLKFQIAVNNDNATWNYIGPDDSSATYYTDSDSVLNDIYNGNRYFRYKAYLMTEDEDYTPALNDVNVEFSSACIPSGQSYFSGLTNDIYTLTVQKTGYQAYFADIDISNSWQEHRVVLIQ